MLTKKISISNIFTKSDSLFNFVFRQKGVLRQSGALRQGEALRHYDVSEESTHVIPERNW